MIDRRLTILAALFLLWGAAICGKLVSLQVIHHAQYRRMAMNRQEMNLELPGPRGTIYDRHGHPLAMSVPTESVYVNPLKVPDLQVASEILALALHVDRAELYGKMMSANENHRGFLWVKRKITFEESQSLRQMRLEWVGIQSESQRHYPNGQLAAHVLGSVDFSETGNAGIEKALDAELRGKPGRMRLLTDVNRHGIDSHLDTEPHAGASLTLTIDGQLQFVAEREIAEAVAAHHAVSGSVVVMDPKNGDILALASYPTFDPNLPPSGEITAEEKAARQNHAASVPFEPGSVFKVMTLSAALETTNLRPDSPINCHGGVLALPGRVIHDSHTGLGIIPMAMVLAKSSNIGAIEVGMRVGQANLYEYDRRFGFGQKTGIELPAESGGRLRKLQRWGKTSWASISMGQEVSVTTLQLAQAGSVIANGGMLVRPRLVLRKSGERVPRPEPVNVIKPETAITMRQMMEGVVMPGGTGTAARLVGYSVGGKTGSAQIFDVATHRYSHNDYNGSFVGFAPLTNPAIVVVVTLNGTHGTAGFGGQAAAPVFHTVAQEALRVFDVPKDLPDEPAAEANQRPSKREDVDDLSIADIGSEDPNILEDGDGDDAAGTADKGPRVPNFRGMTMRAVLAEAASKGMTVVANGSGVARMQSPPAGSPWLEGKRIRVQFAR
ncbi:MAG: transpeptidase family protein [Acidobacteriia bacterium]|nr:transpeptidase family protein [Terriglobia bacterium]